MLTPSIRRESRAHRMSRTAIPILAVALSVTSLAACGVDSAGSGSPTCPNGEIRFGIEPYEDPAKLEPAYRTLADALSEELNCPVNVQVVEDYSAEVLAMRNDQIDLGQFGPLGFVFAHENADAEPLASFGTADGELSSYTAGIWVAKGSNVRDVADLRGKTLALGGVGSTSGDALPRLALKEAGLGEQDVRAEYSGGHSEAMLALTNGTVDAAQINSQTLATAEREGSFNKEDFTQIWESDPVPNDPITVRGDASEEFKTAVREALTTLDSEVVGEVGQYLDVTPPGPLQEVTVDTYRPLFDLAETMGLSEEDVE